MAEPAVTGLVLAGGRGTRMGGADKGLQDFNGVPLALHALRRLAPQVDTTAISANRNLPTYAAFGTPVWPDAMQDAGAGPLAGMLSGLTHCTTPLLATVPCDSPWFPGDLVARLVHALNTESAELAMAWAPDDEGTLRPQPVFCLLRRELAASLGQFVADGGRKVGAWVALHRAAQVSFHQGRDFENANTPQELRRMAGFSP